jgi:ABC-type proline/glycine betaine transport system permease subunit
VTGQRLVLTHGCLLSTLPLFVAVGEGLFAAEGLDVEAPYFNDITSTAELLRQWRRRPGHIVLPSILPGLLQTLRLNLFAASTVVLLAEAVGVGSGLGQVVMLARNTFNASLVFFAMTLIGLTGYLLDMAFRQPQRWLLWWQPASTGGSR